MKKRGFTLAEVLITLGIIGVVAALTAPQLVMSSRNEANAAKLSVVVSNLENAFTNAIVSEGAQDLYGTSLWNGPGGAVNANSSLANRRNFTGQLGRYLTVTGTSNAANNPTNDYYGGSNIHPMNASGGTNTSVNQNQIAGMGFFPIFMKNGAVVHIATFARGNVLTQAQIDNRVAQGVNGLYNFADIAIDVNGSAPPNTYGRDIFYFIVSEKGVLYPAGSADFSFFEDGVLTNTWDQAGHWLTCNNNAYGTQEDVMGLGCTARLIHDGYRMNY